MYMNKLNRTHNLKIQNWNKSFSYQDTQPLRSFLVCILNFDNKTSNHIWLTIWPFVHEQKKKKLDWTKDINSNSYRNSSIYSEAIWVTHFTQLKGHHSSMQVSEKQVAGEARDATPSVFF